MEFRDRDGQSKDLSDADVSDLRDFPILRSSAIMQVLHDYRVTPAADGRDRLAREQQQAAERAAEVGKRVAAWATEADSSQRSRAQHNSLPVLRQAVIYPPIPPVPITAHGYFDTQGRPMPDPAIPIPAFEADNVPPGYMPSDQRIAHDAAQGQQLAAYLKDQVAQMDETDPRRHMFAALADAAADATFANDQAERREVDGRVQQEFRESGGWFDSGRPAIEELPQGTDLPE